MTEPYERKNGRELYMGKDRNRLVEERNRLTEERNNLTEEVINHLVLEVKNVLLTDALFLGKATDSQLMMRIKETIDQRSGQYNIGMNDRERIARRVFARLRGLGILDELLADESVTEIMVNGAKHIFVERAGKIYRVSRTFESEEELYNIIQRIVGKAGKEVNPANPIVDTRLPDGSRVNVVVPPISRSGATVTIRKFSRNPMTVEKLLEYGSITPDAARFLEKLVKARYNIFISGGTGSGKTTFLNAMSNFIPADERIITIEDSAELQIHKLSNLISLETRNANSSGKGEVTIRELIRSALRMRPDRIIVGEVRGEEALDMLQAMNTGHDGSLSTGHANSTRDMLSRLETMVLQGNAGLPLMAIRQQIASALDVIIHLSRLRDKSRRTMEITEVLGCENGEIQLNPLFRFEEDGNSTLNHVNGSLVRTGNQLQNTHKLRLQGINGRI
jgi:pilus assembly protein CpaF